MKRKERGKTAEERIANFHERVRDGPVFPCVCCTRVMFKHQVVIYEKEIQKTIESHDGLFEATIEGLDIHCPLIRGKHYLCKYCIMKVADKKCLIHGLSRTAFQGFMHNYFYLSVNYSILISNI